MPEEPTEAQVQARSVNIEKAQAARYKNLYEGEKEKREALEENVNAPPALEGDLAKAFAMLTQAQQAKRAEDSIKLIRAAVDSLKPDDRQKLINTDAFQDLMKQALDRPGERPQPGSAIRDKDGLIISKVPWRVQDLRERYPMTTWMPTRSGPITVHGHTVFVREGEDITTPSIFKDVFFQSVEADRRGRERIPELIRETTGMDTTVEVGAGPRDV